MTKFEDIAAFHKKFGLAYDGPPRELPKELDDFRMLFMLEELMEYRSTSKLDHEHMRHEMMPRGKAPGDKPSLEKKLDALVDLVYVALGTAYLHGFNFEEAWDRVHGANMKKVRAERVDQSTRKSTFDVVKPPGWTAPDLSDLAEPA